MTWIFKITIGLCCALLSATAYSVNVGLFRQGLVTFTAALVLMMLSLLLVLVGAADDKR